ncbi:MAG: tetratricopeptide repeat protein, partial [Candidatus Altarchaeaceae archaeon]
MIGVFISYETITGKGYAEWLKKALEEAGYICFLADESITKKGDEWRNEIDKALEECKYLIVIITANTMISEEVMKEYQKAKDLRKRIIPCRWKKIPVEHTEKLSILQQIEFEDKYELANKVIHAIKEIEDNEKKDISFPAEEIHLNLGLIFCYGKQYEEAEKEYREAIRINPYYAEAHNNLGILLAELKRYEEAEKEFREAIRINPNLAEVHNNLGILLVGLERYEEAEKEFREAIRINPNYAEAHNNLGILLANLERYEEAEKEFREAIRINPNLAEVHNNLGNLLKDLERYEEAEKEFREAIRINPNLADAHNNLGILLAELKRYEEAEKEFREAI